MIKIEITDSGVVDAFNRLIALGDNPRGALESIGEVVEEFTKQRFQLSEDPYGNPWAANTDATLQAVLRRKQKNEGKISKNKDGSLNKAGLNYLAGKKPLIETGDLSHNISWAVDETSVVVSSIFPYAAMQQFGGTKSEFPNLWGDIPARPFFPNEEQGFPDELRQQIDEVLRTAIQNAISRV